MTALDYLSTMEVESPDFCVNFILAFTGYEVIPPYDCIEVKGKGVKVIIYKFKLAKADDNPFEPTLTCSIALNLSNNGSLVLSGVSMEGSLSTLELGCVRNILLDKDIYDKLFEEAPQNDKISYTKIESAKDKPIPQIIDLEKTRNGYELSIVYRPVELERSDLK